MKKAKRRRLISYLLSFLILCSVSGSLSGCRSSGGNAEQSEGVDSKADEYASIIIQLQNRIEELQSEQNAEDSENEKKLEDLKENTDSIDDEAGDESSESFDSDEDIDDEDFFVAQKDSDVALADEDVEEKIGKSSAQGVLINDKEKSSDSERSLDIFDSSTLLTLAGFIVGLAILIIGITYYASSSDRVVDNVLSGETAGLAIFLIIIGLIIIGFSLLKFFSSSKSSLVIDTFNSIKSIDYDEISEDGFTREDFDAIFGILKRKKDSNFSDSGDNDKSVDSSKDLFENDKEEELSDDDINSLYSDSNLTSQKNQSSFKEHENANSTEVSDDYDETDDDSDEIIPIHSRLNKQSDESDLEDKYSKYDFDDSDDDMEESVEPKPKFKKSVDLSKFENEDLTEEELAEKERRIRELEEKKRRIIEGTNFDNSLRKE